MEAIRDDNVRVVMILKAAQTLGSLTWDMALHWLIVHSPYKTVQIFIDSDEKAVSYCDRRLMPTLKANKDIAPYLPTGAQRFDNSKTEILFTNGKQISMGGLNERNCSSLTSEVVVIDEGWEHASDSLMQKAIDRTKQIAHRKIIIVGQAGKANEDQDRIWNGLHHRCGMTFNCPACGGKQEFNLTQARPDDFMPLRALLRPDLSLPAVAPLPNTFYGLKSPKRFSEIKTATEIKEVAMQTTYECYWCGFEIPDNKEMRRALMKTYRQDWRKVAADGTVYTPPDYEVGFWLPDPASVTVPFAQTMQAYISAWIADDRLGNRQPLQDFYQNRWATAYNPDLAMRAPEKIAASIYDTKEKVPGEFCRIAAADFQFNGTHMPYQAWSIGDGTPPRLLHWEWIKPPAGLSTDHDKLEWCKNRARELNKEFDIEHQNFMIDCGHRPDLVREWAAEDHILGKIRSGKFIRQKVITYGLLIGDERLSYRYDNPGRAATWERFKKKEAVMVDLVKDNQRKKVVIQHRLWSNPSIKAIAERWRDGNSAPKIEVHEKFLKDGTKDGFWAQMNSERLVPWKGRPGKFRWDNEGRPNHAWDGFCMVMVRMDELELLSHLGPPPEDKEQE